MKKLARLGVMACVSAIASLADAHAFLDHAVPAVGSTVHAAPTSIRLWFTQRLEPAFSTAQLHDAKGTRIDKAVARVDPGDPNVIEISVPALPPGSYRVSWRVLSVDTHVTNGDFAFDVAP